MIKTKSPCIGKCSCTLGDDVCRGCGRTAEQVRDWNGYTEEQKAEVLRELRRPEGLGYTEEQKVEVLKDAGVEASDVRQKM